MAYLATWSLLTARNMLPNSVGFFLFSTFFLWQWQNGYLLRKTVDFTTLAHLFLCCIRDLEAHIYMEVSKSTHFRMFQKFIVHKFIHIFFFNQLPFASITSSGTWFWKFTSCCVKQSSTGLLHQSISSSSGFSNSSVLTICLFFPELQIYPSNYCALCSMF